MYEGPDGRTWRSPNDYARYQDLQEKARRQVEIETWPVIQGFGRYVISQDGVVFNRVRIREVKPNFGGGRWKISLVSDEGEQRTLSLARLVAIHHIGIPENQEQPYYDVIHKDGDYNNLHVSNLAWVARYRRLADPDNYGVDI